MFVLRGYLFWVLFLLPFIFIAGCKELNQSTVGSDDSSQISNKSVAEHNLHKGDWPLIEGETPRTVWMDGVWGMKLPNCQSETTPRSTLIMNYSDFNFEHDPEALSELLGPYKWIWSNEVITEPDSFDGDNDIKVIIYQITGPENSLEDIKKRYSTDKSEQLDFRYLAYTDALAYLDEASVTVYREALAQIMVARKFEIKGMFCDIPH